MASLSLRHLSKTYDNGVNAIRDFTLEVDDKEFMIFAGPVGCGISTVLLVWRILQMGSCSLTGSA